MTEKIITGWTIKRSGARMTVSGVDNNTGEDIKVSADEIAIQRKVIVATDRKLGIAHVLGVMAS